MSKCEYCNGSILQLWDEVKCAMCGRVPSSVQPDLDFIFSVEIKNPIEGYQSSYKDFDLHSVTHRTALRQFMNRCLGSGMQGIKLTTRKVGTSSIDKAKCRVCDSRQFLTKTAKVITHLPSNSIRERIQAALDTIKLEVEKVCD